jgi:phenol 2-monooxygenase (NADPH)
VEVAQQLINFDRKFSELFGGKPAIAEQAGISVEKFRNLWPKSGKWTSGSLICGEGIPRCKYSYWLRKFSSVR